MTKAEYEAINEKNKAARIEPNKADPGNWGMLNVYICPRGHFTFTIDRDYGVTPFTIRCEHRQKLASHGKGGTAVQCRESAESEMYRVPKEYESRATHEFYRPSFEYFQNLKNQSLKRHIAQGSLAFRKVGDLDCYQ